MNTPINSPELWHNALPRPQTDGHKYDRGHALIIGGGWETTGAAKLAARAALRIGAGLVSVTCDAKSLPLYAASFQAVMTKLIEQPLQLAGFLADARIRSVLAGPGMGVNHQTRDAVHLILAARKATVLDADALTAFADMPQGFLKKLHANCILTPHEGEFSRLFGTLIPADADRITRALEGARLSRSIMVLKGAETIIAAPDGRYCVNRQASPYLATAGSGDVLAGMCTGLLAQGMQPYEAACAAVWMHGTAALQFGPGLIAEDLSEQLPSVLKQLG